MKTKPLIIIALVIVAGVIAALVLLSGGESTPDTDTTQPASWQKDNTKANSADPQSVVSTTDSPDKTTAKSTRPGDAARDLIARLRSGEITATPGELYTDAQEYLREGLVADAHLLLFFLARDGHTPSAVALAEMYDPLHFDEKRSLLGEADASQALKWYQMAARNQNAVAKDRLKTMRVWVEARARDGDTDATSLLLSWP